MLQGTFAHPVCISWTYVNGSPGPCASTGTQISAIDPVAAAYVKDIYSKFPAPQSGFNLLSTLDNISNFREDMVKIDHVFSRKLTVSGKILRDSIPTIEAGGVFTGYPVNGIATTSTSSPGHQYSIHATAPLSPTLVVDVSYGFSYGAILSHVTGLENFSSSPDIQSALTGLPFKNILGRVPAITINGGTGVTTFGPYNDYDRNQTVGGNLTKVVGSHTLKFGAIFYHVNKHENQLSGSNNGSFSFTNTNQPAAGSSTFEQSWANFLMGNVSGSPSFQQADQDLTANIFDNQFEYYAQDTWRIKSNLTVTYGVRHSLFREPTDASGPGGTSRLSNFDPAFWKAANAPCITTSGNIDVTLTNGIPTKSACNSNYSPLNGIIYVDPPNYHGFTGAKSPYGSKVGKEYNRAIAPRIGIAWDPYGNGRTSIRAGYGMFYDAGLFLGNAELNLALNPGFVTNDTFSNVTFSNPQGATATTVTSTGAPTINLRVPINYKSPYTQQWSVDMQRQMGSNWFFDLGYFGNSGIHLPGFVDTNAPVPGAWLKCAAPNSCTSGPNIIQFTSANGGAACNGLPCITSSNTNRINVLRPYLGYAGLNDFEDIFTSNYHSLQAQVQKKFSGNSLINLAYTWSHGLTTDQADRSTAAVIPQSYTAIRSNNYGPNIADRRHVFTANFVYDMPWMREQHGFLGHVVGGWEVSGVQTFQTGLPINVAVSGANVVDTAGVGCLGSTPCQLRPDQVGNPELGAPHSLAQWFNASAYACYGTAGDPLLKCTPYTGQTNIGTARPGSARGPGFWRTDIGLFKNIRFSERFTGQLRLETFNTFNHTNPIQPGGPGGSGSANITSGVFDLSQYGRDPRLLQLGMKVNF
jgi:hypothetical protein